MITISPRELLIRTQAQANWVIVAVRDSGIGIDPENRSRLANLFFTTKPEGVGMGLSICRSIVEAHGGEVEVADNAGPGATFQLTLPTTERPGHGRG